MKTFCSAEHIENLAAQGKTELLIDDNTVLTDLARHTADQLGVKIVQRSGTAPAEPSPAVLEINGSFVSGSAPVQPVQISRPTSAGLGSHPKGCQHGPLNTHQQPSVGSSASKTPNNSSSGGSSTIVDQLVGLVKRLGRNES